VVVSKPEQNHETEGTYVPTHSFSPTFFETTPSNADRQPIELMLRRWYSAPYFQEFSAAGSSVWGFKSVEDKR
jgi:hypothetical protein